VVPLPIQEDSAAASTQADLMLELDEALDRLATVEPRLAQVVECRYFGGLSDEETATVLHVTARTVRRDWVRAKAWLYHALDG
jgi:RNA polymerase sigma factor (sigma-70 family)